MIQKIMNRRFAVEDRLLINLAFRPLNNLTFSGYVAPIDERSSRSPYGASLVWQLENKPNSPTLSFNWQKQEYDYGNGPFGLCWSKIIFLPYYLESGIRVIHSHRNIFTLIYRSESIAC
jgi:hypothetical protein